MPMEIKICGLKRVEDALMVNEFENIKYVGFVFVIFTYIYKDGEEEELSVIKIVRNKKEFKTRYKNCWCFCRTAYGRNN